MRLPERLWWQFWTWPIMLVGVVYMFVDAMFLHGATDRAYLYIRGKLSTAWRIQAPAMKDHVKRVRTLVVTEGGFLPKALEGTVLSGPDDEKKYAISWDNGRASSWTAHEIVTQTERIPDMRSA